jgi:iron complex outermembrane recepter protein
MSLKTKTMRERLLASTVIVGALALATAGHAADAIQTAPGAGPQAPASASDQPQSTTVPSSEGSQAASSTVKEVVVTGSLFRRTNTETPSPVTLLSSDQIAKQGIVTISDAVRSISADNSGTIPNAFGAGFAAGASGVSLRGLTAADTLVLIDGLRTANYPIADDGVRSFVDLNTIPLVALDRVEVLKDGASSIYGADAVAGVVNIITRQTYKGFQADASYGDSQHGGGKEIRGSALIGYGDLDEQRFNVYAGFEYQNDDRITVGQRGFPYNTADLSSIGGQNLIGGQPGLNSGSIYGSVTPGTLGTPGDLKSGVPNPGATSQILRGRGCGVGGSASVDSAGNAYCAQNFSLYGDDQPAQIRWGLDGRATFKINNDNQAYATVYYYQNKISINGGPPQIQASAPINTNGIALPPTLTSGALNPNNPFAAAGQYALLNYAFGDIPSENTLDNHVVRGSAGIKGDLLGFNYEADLTIAHSSLNTVNHGFINYDQLITDINSGAYSFINPASNTADVLSALSPALSKVSTSDLDTFDIHLSRDIYQLPGGPLSLAIGGQLRYEANNDPGLNSINSDGTATAGTVIGLGLANTSGHRYVGAFFFEADAPIIKMLDLNFSGRYDHYSDFGGNFSPKVGLKFTPFRELALRATYSQGFRAPSFSQNGSAESEGFINYNPVSSAPQSFINQHLGANGQPDAYVQQYSQASLTVANPAIQPETSESFTFGAIYEPNRHINVSVDYYHIHQSGIIAQSDSGAVLSAYYAGTALPEGASIQLDNPDPLNPNGQRRVTVVAAPFVNENSLITDGLDVDFRANYKLPFNVQFTSELNATDIFGYEYTSSGSTFNYVGTQAPYILSSGAGTPKYKVNWANTFTWDKLSVTGTMYFTSGYKQTGVDAFGSSDVQSACIYSDALGNPFPSGCHIRDFWDFDMTASYQLTNNIQLYANVLNLFDENPPINPADYAGINYNPTYAQAGIIGRYFRAGARVKF